VRDIMTMHPFLVETGPHASFAAHWSADGTKFGVASQSGVVGIWDVRSDKPLWSYQTAFRIDNNSSSNGGGNQGNESGSTATSRTPVSSSLPSSFIDSFLLSDIPLDRDFNLGTSGFLTRLYEQWRGGAGRMKYAPPYGVRCLKFGRGAASDLVAFTEHTRRVHVLDIRRFECHQILEIPEGPPQGNIQADTTAENAPTSPAGPSTPDRNPRPRPRRRSAILVDPRMGSGEAAGGRSPSPNSQRARVTRALGTIRARLSQNLAEEFGLTLGSGSESMEQLQDQPQQASTSTSTSTTEPEVQMEDVSISLTDVGDGVLHISSHSGPEDEDVEREVAEVGSSTLTPPGRVVWRTIGTRASSPQPRVTETASTSRRVPGTRSHGVYINRAASISQDLQGYTTTSGNDTPTPGNAARSARRTHVRSTSSTTTLAPDTEDTGDIAGLSWSASGESLFIATTKAIIEWRISDFGRARSELGGGGNEWCEEGEDMGGQEMVWR